MQVLKQSPLVAGTAGTAGTGGKEGDPSLIKLSCSRGPPVISRVAVGQDACATCIRGWFNNCDGNIFGKYNFGKVCISRSGLLSWSI
jgi:hypothetical protein